MRLRRKTAFILLFTEEAYEVWRDTVQLWLLFQQVHASAVFIPTYLLDMTRLDELGRWGNYVNKMKRNSLARIQFMVSSEEVTSCKPNIIPHFTGTRLYIVKIPAHAWEKGDFDPSSLTSRQNLM